MRTGVFSPAKVQPPEEQRPLGQFPHRLGPTAQPVPEDLGVGPGGGDVRTDDDLFIGAGDHRVEGGTAAVVVGSFGAQKIAQGRVVGRHSTERTRKT